MSQVALVINGRSYRVACDDGQEDRVRELGRIVDERVTDLASRVGQVGEMQLLVMAALLLADELEDARGGASGGAGISKDERADDAEAAAVAVLEACAGRLEGIAERLERA